MAHQASLFQAENAVIVKVDGTSILLSFIAAGAAVPLIIKDGNPVPKNFGNYYVVMESGTPIQVLSHDQALKLIAEGFKADQVTWQCPG